MTTTDEGTWKKWQLRFCHYFIHSVQEDCEGNCGQWTWRAGFSYGHNTQVPQRCFSFLCLHSASPETTRKRGLQGKGLHFYEARGLNANKSWICLLIADVTSDISPNKTQDFAWTRGGVTWVCFRIYGHWHTLAKNCLHPTSVIIIHTTNFIHGEVSQWDVNAGGRDLFGVHPQSYNYIVIHIGN